MKSVRFLVLIVLVMGIAMGASAQATRTWVSGVGDDANPCSRTAPCKTFAGAISKTATNGIINAIDAGGFGAVTITKSITIDATPHMAGVLAASTTGIIVNSAGINVRLRGLDIEGANTGVNGVSILAAASVIIERCNIFGFNALSPNGNGVNINTTAVTNVVIRDTTISNNSRHGVRATTTSILNKVMLENARVYQNGQSGLDLVTNILATVNGSTIAQNSASGILFENGTSNGEIYNTSLDNNAVGITTAAVGQARIYGSQITHNTTSISSATGVLTHGNNAIINNQTNTQPSLSVTPAAANGQQ